VLGYGVFWLIGTVTALSAFFIERTAFPAGPARDRLVRTAVIAFSLIVVCGLLLGTLGWIGITSYVVFSVAGFIGVLRTSVRGGGLERTAEHLPGSRVVLAVLLPVLVLIAAVGLAAWPSRYDSLNYHLYFPAQWLQAGRISIVPTPFGDEAPAYAPSNGELFFLWLMVPFHGDLLARVGQLPFYLLIGAALYALARRAGAPPDRAIYPAAFGLLARPIVEEAVGADVDLLFTALLLSAWYLGVIAIESDQRSRDWTVLRDEVSRTGLPACLSHSGVDPASAFECGVDSPGHRCARPAVVPAQLVRGGQSHLSLLIDNRGPHASPRRVHASRHA